VNGSVSPLGEGAGHALVTPELLPPALPPLELAAPEELLPDPLDAEPPLLPELLPPAEPPPEPEVLLPLDVDDPPSSPAEASPEPGCMPAAPPLEVAPLLEDVEPSPPTSGS
jgi:hypothetical protein